MDPRRVAVDEGRDQGRVADRLERLDRHGAVVREAGAVLEVDEQEARVGVVEIGHRSSWWPRSPAGRAVPAA
jgi:hypothetical protein